MTLTKAILATALVAAAAGATGTLGQATTPARDGQIAFQRYHFTDKPLWAELFVANTDGTGAHKITHTPRGAQDSDPDWSPDGSRLVFQRCGPTEGACFVWSVNANRTGERRLSPRCRHENNAKLAAKCVTVDDFSPVYSPDGRAVAFVRHSGRLDRKRDRIQSAALMVADPNLKHVRRAFWFGPYKGDLESGVAWSPSGKQLAFTDAIRHGIFIVNVTGQPRLHRVTPKTMRAGADRIDWSPDGSRILFRTMPLRGSNTGGNLYTIRPNGTGLRQLTHYQPDDTRPGALWTGSFSPDGSSIVFATLRGATGADVGLPDVFVMSSNGTNVRPVTRTQNWDGSPDWGPAR